MDDLDYLFGPDKYLVIPRTKPESTPSQSVEKQYTKLCSTFAAQAERIIDKDIQYLTSAVDSMSSEQFKAAALWALNWQKYRLSYKILDQIEDIISSPKVLRNYFHEPSLLERLVENAQNNAEENYAESCAKFLLTDIVPIRVGQKIPIKYRTLDMIGMAQKKGHKTMAHCLATAYQNDIAP